MKPSTPNQADGAVLLQNCCFVPNLAATTREEALVALVAVLARVYPVLPEAEILQSVLHRERLRTTGTLEGVAFPHGKHAGIHGLYAAVATQPEGIDFGSEQVMPCQILILTVSSAYRADGHLQFLGYMARYLRIPSVRAAVLAAQHKADFIRALRAVGT